MTTKDEALQQALVALELSQPARCGQSDEMYEQERQAHRAAALRLAEIFEQYEGTIIDQAEAATELRRLHALNQELLEALNVALSNHIGDANKMVEHPAQRRTDYAVHLHHCNIGEYEGACKYGDPDYPALKPVQHDAEGPINEGWQITVADGHSGYGVYAHMEDYPEEGAVFVMPVEQPAQQQYPLPNDLYASKDWREGSYSERVAWLHTMYEGAKKTLDDYLEQPAQQQEPVAWMVMNGVCTYQLLASKRQADVLCAEMQKRHDLSGSWASFHVQPLYTSPLQRKPLSEDQIRDIVFKAKRVAGQSSFVKSYVDMCRMIEQAHGIKE